MIRVTGASTADVLRDRSADPASSRHAWTAASLRHAIVERASVWGWHAHVANGFARPTVGFASVSRRQHPIWPELTLLRGRDRRIIFAELLSSRALAALSPARRDVLGMLQALEWDAASRERQVVEGALGHCAPVVQTFVWRPGDLLDGTVDEVLR